jgi:UDP-N-acetylmuramoyl-tripeptide--D-alanyl-D-alanine ligase
LGEAVVAVPNRDAAIAVLREILRPGDAVLVKASRGAELELIVESLAADRGSWAGDAAAGSGPAASSGAVEDDR